MFLKPLAFMLSTLLISACQIGADTATTEAAVLAGIMDALPMESRIFKMGTAGFVPAGYPDPSNQAWQEFFRSGASSYGSLYGVHLIPSGSKNEQGVQGFVSFSIKIEAANHIRH